MALKYTGVETCPFTHQAYIALTCNKGGRFSVRYVLKAHAAELTKAQQLSQRCQEVLSCVLLALLLRKIQSPHPLRAWRVALDYLEYGWER